MECLWCKLVFDSSFVLLRHVRLNHRSEFLKNWEEWPSEPPPIINVPREEPERRQPKPTGLTRNTQRLLDGLLRIGVEIDGFTAFAVIRDHGQPMMNKAASEYAPTWSLHDNVSHSMGRRMGVGRLARVKAHGRTYEGVESDTALTTILKCPPEHWELSLADNGHSLWIDVPDAYLCPPGKKV